MLRGIDHINVSTNDMDATLAFYQTVLGLRAKAAPGKDAAENSWLYDRTGNALVHVNLRQHAIEDGPINHAAFSCSGYDAICQKLSTAGYRFSQHDKRATSGVRQIFVRSPEGALIELNFRDD